MCLCTNLKVLQMCENSLNPFLVSSFLITNLIKSPISSLNLLHTAKTMIFDNKFLVSQFPGLLITRYFAPSLLKDEE